MPVLDIAALLKPVPGADPGGPPPDQIRDKEGRDPTHLEKIRREAKEKKPDGGPTIDSLPVNDPIKVKHWRDGMKLAQDLFATRSKNLGWAVYAVDAAAAGAAGLARAREGFQFLTKLTTDHWDWLWPRPNLANVEKADPDDRDSVRKEEEAAATEAGGGYQSLDDSAGGLLFPNVLRETAIAEHDGAIVSVFACRGADGKAATMDVDEVRAVARKLGPDRVREILAEIDGALEDLEALRAATEARFAEANAADLAPSFREVRLALEDCRKVADDMYAAVEVVNEPAADTTAGDGRTAAASGGGSDALTRTGIYNQIAKMADQLMRLEPHSPVPHLLRRVVELQDLPFPMLVRELTKASSTVLDFLEKPVAESSGG